jgi:hypothetical protein
MEIKIKAELDCLRGEERKGSFGPEKDGSEDRGGASR